MFRPLLLITVLAISTPGFAATNLLADPSFEATKAKDSVGRVFEKWGGWKYDGDCEFGVGRIPHSGTTSGLILCNSTGKIRMAQLVPLSPGRYLITAHIRGLDIQPGDFGNSTEFMFNDKYISMKKSGTFGWTRLTYVADVSTAAETAVSFGLWGTGRFWVDDVSLERVSGDTKLTESPVLSKEESPILPPGKVGMDAVHCAHCRYKNQPEWHKCFACGETLPLPQSEFKGQAEKLITSFEGAASPFTGGTVSPLHATHGAKALRIDSGYAVMSAKQDWNGYDFLKIDTFAEGKVPVPLYLEIQDIETKDYWTRVNFNSLVPPGKSTLIIPLKRLFVGEKGRPGRNLILKGITRLVIEPRPAKPTPVFVDNLRLEHDFTGPKAQFEGLHAFDFGPSNSPVMDGYTAVTPSTIYSPGIGYGLKDAKIWRAFNSLHPDPLYQDFLCIESGYFVADVPNGKYHVVMNIDAPAGFWGEMQAFKRRGVLVNGKSVVGERQIFESFQQKLYFFWDKDDFPSENIFEKYTRVHFSEKAFDVEVTDGQLAIEFRGETWANSISSLVLFPVEKAEEGARFLEYSKNRRQFYFNIDAKRTLHEPTGEPLAATLEDERRGFITFTRDFMRDIFYNDTPVKSEVSKPLTGEGFPGQSVPLIAGIVPLRDLGMSTFSISDLTGTQGKIPASSISAGYGSYRVTRVTNEGSIYTIAPRYVMPLHTVDLPKGTTRSLWFIIQPPEGTQPGTYNGTVTVETAGGSNSLPVKFTVRKGSIDPVDIPVGAFGGHIYSPYQDLDPKAAAFSSQISTKSLNLLRAKGFTLFSGVPHIVYQGFKSGLPQLDFTLADKEMQEAKALGFLAVTSYGAGIAGFDPYFQDLEKMKAAGFEDYRSFIRSVYTSIQLHAQKAAWLPVYWNLGDEPGGDDLPRAVTNAATYRDIFQDGPPYFTGATSLFPAEPSYQNSLALAHAWTVPMFSMFDESSINKYRAGANPWAMYGTGDRWNFGTFLYKAVSQFGLKFRIGWHWNVASGDPYYALDAREDDYCWANTGPNQELIPSIEFVRITAGLDDYRMLLTASRLAKEKAGTAASVAARKLITARLSSFTLNDRDHDKLFGVEDYAKFRRQLADAIESLQ